MLPAEVEALPILEDRGCCCDSFGRAEWGVRAVNEDANGFVGFLSGLVLSELPLYDDGKTFCEQNK